MHGFDPGPWLFFVFGWLFALNVKGLAERTYRFAARRGPVIGGVAAFRAMGWLWVLVSGAYLVMTLI
ncbi:hypothetical protein [Streptomyces sp. NRRL F-5065]|uniref:hypothetical protein n=1 Tax=Streptomyces sp. NRRL F-5065 TaxID=1463855 RepID=UPI0004BE5A0C|nr:hypothetical protein [Streptomyces sp. NRRL F-5065]